MTGKKSGQTGDGEISNPRGHKNTRPYVMPAKKNSFIHEKNKGLGVDR